jgi:adenosylhomocysteine nucleosidase
MWRVDDVMGDVKKAKTILIVAALKRELAWLARMKLPNVELLDTGEGRANADRALRAWFEKNDADFLICVGFAGALSPALQIGDLVIDKNSAMVSEILSRERSKTPAGELGFSIHPGRIITVDEILGATGKRELAATLDANELACAEMESSAVAKVCVERSVPLLLLRAISDLFDEDFPIDFNRCRNRDGRLSTAKVLRALLLKPQAINGLLALNRRANLCAARLAWFIEQTLPLWRESVPGEDAISLEK